jgi:UDP-N-acetylmuramate--alanine ligase
MSEVMTTESGHPIRKTPREGPFAGKRVHMIGVGGSGMRALAKMLLVRGATVSGSDMAASDAVDRLAESGATIHIGQSPENLPADCDMVVHSAAVHPDNPELVAAGQAGIETLKYSQMLGQVMAGHVGIAVAGTHGKSTTTAMVAYGLCQAGVDPSFVVGAAVPQLGGPSGVGCGEHFVAEACEFDRSFLSLRPRHATVLNLEEDHLDCYRDLEAIIEAFRAFVSQIAPEGTLVVNGEDRHAMASAGAARCAVETFGLSDPCRWRAVDLKMDRGRCRMQVELAGEPFCRIASRLPGVHNAYNALAATALLHLSGIEADTIGQCLSNFTGAQRRSTLKAQVAGVTVVDDYAHHPTEIQATLRALWDFYQPKRLICVFQPHQHSRTRFLLKDFARSFGVADEVILPDIYFVRDSDREKDYISSEDLVSQIRLNGGVATYCRTLGEIVRQLANGCREGDLVVTMGAGNIWEVADELVLRLGTDR